MRIYMYCMYSKYREQDLKTHPVYVDGFLNFQLGDGLAVGGVALHIKPCLGGLLIPCLPHTH